MVIVLQMAGGASLRRALEHVVDVALGALDRLVLAHEFERCQIVIELCALPTVRGVALRAIGAEGAVVGVVFPVAIDAGGRCAREVRRRPHLRVALAAGDLTVLAAQRKLQAIVIETGKPIGPIVARQTIAAEVGHMLRHEIRLIPAMARFTPRLIELGYIIAVAVGARKRLAIRHGLMSRQLEFQAIVREVLQRHARQRSAGAVVLGVAGAAHFHIRQRTVQRVGIVELGAHVGVAGQAARRHDRAAPRIDVAGRAVPHQFRV